MTTPGDAGGLVDHFFREEWGNLVALLTRALGLRHVELAEDVVQEALVKALEVWAIQGPPREPRAWLYRVAKNLAIDRIRRERIGDRVWETLGAMATPWEQGLERLFLETEVRDDRLRLVFACCHPQLPVESQLALTLKTLGGLSVREIARALVTNEAAIEKRLYRAREQFRAGNVEYAIPAGDALAPRIDAVCRVIYLVFTEGYAATEADDYIRRDLCGEALRLCGMLIEAPVKGAGKAEALGALLCLTAARFDARLGGHGEILLLEEQDRRLWDAGLIAEGLRLLAASAQGDRPSIYHIEAGIAAEHCCAPSFAATNWTRISALYDMLVATHPSPMHTLNMVIARVYSIGPTAALRTMEAAPELQKLQHLSIYHATRADLLHRSGHTDAAVDAWLEARRLTRSPAERELIERKLAAAQQA